MIIKSIGITTAELADIAQIVQARIEKRTRDSICITGGMEASLVLSLSTALCEDESRAQSSGTQILLEGGSKAAILYAAGRLLRSCTYTLEGCEAPEAEFFHKPRKPVCGMYFATHFHNYYHAAPLEEILEYVEDLALWGMNTLSVWFDMHHYTGMEDPQAALMCERLLAVLGHAKKLGIKVALTTISNEAFNTSPAELRADWTAGHDGYIRQPQGHYHVEICPSKVGGCEQIEAYRREMLKVFAAVDPNYVWIWPYDQGGCTCRDCAPWGSNGFIKAAEVDARIIREYCPNAKIVLSTWYFGLFTGTETEWDGLWQAFAEGRLPYVDYIMADFPASFPEYPLKHGTPKGLPMVSFSEISMYGAAPWGGYGANPLPRYIQKLWDDAAHMLSGGFPYSEGIYEDINKVILLRLFQDGADYRDTIREYLSYECRIPQQDIEEACAAVMALEETHMRHWQPFEAYFPIECPEKIAGIAQSLGKINGSLPQAWQRNLRWRQIYLRAMIDKELQAADFHKNEASEAFFCELDALYHTGRSGYYTRPPRKEALENPIEV